MHRILVAALLVAAPLFAFAGERSIVASNFSEIHDSAAREYSTWGTAAAGHAKTPLERYWLYGAPGSNEGGFESPSGSPDWQGWVSVDGAEQESYWQVSDFNAENLGNHGAGNRAVWCGQTAEQQPGWNDAPGYGNGWNQVLAWESPPLIDPSIAQNVELEFFFHYEFEPGYDYFIAEYDSAGETNQPNWYYYGSGGGNLPVMSVSGTNFDGQSATFPAPGERFTDHATRPIAYTGNDYGAPGDNVIRLRLRFLSDGAFSDEGGLWPTIAGAVQVDDIRVRWDDGTGTIQESFEDFEGVDPLVNGEWRREQPFVVGDFASILPGVSDLDPCVANPSPLVAFIDYGQEVNNADAPDFPAWGPTSTGGSLSATWSYGIPGGWVVNYTGGLFNGFVPFDNEVRSPPIAWDLAGGADDGADVVGAVFEFDVYEHLPVLNGLFWRWKIRSRSAGAEWSEWRDRNFVYFSDQPFWSHKQMDVSDLLVESPAEVQVSLGVEDLADFYGLPGGDATPAPYFDNVQLWKYRAEGPRIRVRESRLAQDGFPSSGAIDASDPFARDALDVRFDMAAAINTGLTLARGDSIVVAVTPVRPGASLADVRMLWVLDRNPLFDDVRSAPARAGLDENVNLSQGPGQWSGEVLGESVFTSGGQPVAHEFAFDLPDQDLLYPGDVLRYAIQATDSDGYVSTMPQDLSGLSTGEGHDPLFRVRCLPSLSDVAGSQPTLLLLDQTHDLDQQTVLRQLLQDLSYVEGVDYDHYRVAASDLDLGNGIGAEGAQGASTQQLAAYTQVLFVDGDRGNPLGSAGESWDRSPDIERLTAWHALPGDRAMIAIGGDIAGRLAEVIGGAAFVSDVLSSTVGGSELHDAVVGGTALSLERVVTQPFVFGDPVGVFAACVPAELEGEASFTKLVTTQRRANWQPGEDIQPRGVAYTGHRFFDGGGSPLANSSATVVHDRIDGSGDRKIDITVALPLEHMSTMPAKQPIGPNARVRFVADLLAYVGLPSSHNVTEAPSSARTSFSIAPNPFNPMTEISLRPGASGPALVRVFDLRGRSVRTLYRGRLEAGIDQVLRWDGRDDGGQAMASGVYLVKVAAPDFTRTQKVALIK